jgi:hypothetical protein
VSAVRCADGVCRDRRSAASRAQTLVGQIYASMVPSYIHSPAANGVFGIVHQSRRQLFDTRRWQRQLQVLQQRAHPGP